MDYWKTCIEEALCDSGLEATEEQINNIATWVEGAHENYGMATGEECIPNPLNSEVEQLKKEIKKIEAEHERQINGICKGVARRRGTSANDVSIDSDGLVTYK